MKNPELPRCTPCVANCEPCEGDECDKPTCVENPGLPECTPDVHRCDEPGQEACPVDGRVRPPHRGGGSLPFTGPGDVVLAVVLALLMGTGGMLLLMGAGSREAFEGMTRRSMGSSSGFERARRELLKRDMED